MCKKTRYEDICNKSSITESLCIAFINLYNITETEDKINECDEELHQHSTVNTPETSLKHLKLTRLPPMYLMPGQIQKAQNRIVRNCNSKKLMWWW